MAIDMDLGDGKGLIVLVRHGESEGNRANIFTGLRDLSLTARGRDEARSVANRLAASSIHFDVAFCSALNRTRETTDIILAVLGLDIEVRASSSLNERDYGDLTGLNKTEAAAQWGARQIRIWRRSFETRPPRGESLKDTEARVGSYYNAEIMPLLMGSKRVLVVAHGNSLRALIMRLESLSPIDVERVELRTGEIRSYQVGVDGKASHPRLWPD